MSDHTKEKRNRLTTRREAPEPTARRFGVFILGAGFSRPAGLPLANDLWGEVRRRADGMSGRASFFRDDLDAYIQFRRECYGEALTPDKVDFEDFMAFLDIEHYLGLRGNDTWSDDGNEAQIVVKTLIGEILTERTPPKERLPDIYLRFAEMLQPDDLVLTFNYDVLLERALEAVGQPFRLFPQRLKPLYPGGSDLSVDTSREEVVLLKLHGSVDWFDRRSYSRLEVSFRRSGSTDGPYHPVFKPKRELAAVPLVGGARFSDDPLREMHRVLDIEQLYRSRPLFQVAPWLLNPSSAKILYAEKQKDFWWGLGDWGSMNFAMAIIGFSLSGPDDYARQVLYRLVKNYQCNYWEEGVLGRTKTPLVLVDLRELAGDKEDFKRRYAFVNWERTKTHFAGFDDEALELLRHN